MMEMTINSTIKHCALGVLIAFVFGAAYIFEMRLNTLYREVQKRTEELSLMKQINSDLKTKVDQLEKKAIVSTDSLSHIKEFIEEEQTLRTEQLTGLGNELSGYPDVVVQAACAAVATNGFVSAIRRPCSEEAPSCDVICKDATPQMKAKNYNQGGKQATCIQTFHFYGTNQKLEPGIPKQANMIMFRYSPGDCSKQYCGPNFCCCKL